MSIDVLKGAARILAWMRRRRLSDAADVDRDHHLPPAGQTLEYAELHAVGFFARFVNV